MTKVNIDEWEAARITFYNVLNYWNDQDSHVRAQMRHMMDVIKNNLDIIEKQKRNEEILKKQSRKESTHKRKILRDELITQWCEENLKPGMIVKVKANSATKYREIESVQHSKTMANGHKFDGQLTGRHVRYVRRRDQKTSKTMYELVKEGYITDHLFKNVQGIIKDFDAKGKPVVTPIMEIIEGK